MQAAPTQYSNSYVFKCHAPRAAATGSHTVAISACINLRQPHSQPSRTSSFASCSRARPLLNTRRSWVKGSILLSRRVHTIPYAHNPAYAHATLAHLHKVHPVLGLSSVQAVDPVHAFKLIGMLLDAHMNLMTIDIVRLLDSPEMVRLYPRPAAASRPHTCMLTQSLPFNTRAVPQLLNNIKEAKEVLAASLARGDAGPVAESLEQMKTSEAKTEEQEMKAEKPKPQVGRPCSPSVYGATKPLYSPIRIPGAHPGADAGADAQVQGNPAVCPA